MLGRDLRHCLLLMSKVGEEEKVLGVYGAVDEVVGCRVCILALN